MVLRCITWTESTLVPFKAGVGKLRHGPWAKCGPPPVFVDQVLLEYSHTHIDYISTVTAFMIQQWSQLVVTEAIWPAKPRIFII